VFLAWKKLQAEKSKDRILSQLRDKTIIFGKGMLIEQEERVMGKKEKAIEAVKIEPDKMSIFELVKQLEKGIVKPGSINKEILKKCADVYKGRGYSNSQIAEILEVDQKTVQRYIKQQREENNLVITEGFQKKIIGQVVKNWQTQYQRLLKLSYSDNLTPNEIMKAIYLAHQVEKDGVELLERLGYLRKEKISEEKNEPDKMIVIRDANEEIKDCPEFKKLSSERKDQIRKILEGDIVQKADEAIKNVSARLREANFPKQD